jgi:hypothetical protein
VQTVEGEAMATRVEQLRGHDVPRARQRRFPPRTNRGGTVLILVVPVLVRLCFRSIGLALFTTLFVKTRFN